MSGGLGFGQKNLIDKIIKENWPKGNPDDKNFNYQELLYIVQEMQTEEGKKYLQGGKRPRGHAIFRHFVRHLLYRNVANFDSMILLEGTKGSGKSSAAIMLAKAWINLLGKPWNPKKYIAYSNKDLMTKIDQAKKFDVIIADESARFCCVSKDTLITTDKGKFKIKDLVNKKDVKVLSYNDKGKDEYKDFEQCIKVRNDYVFEIETEDGKKIKATEEHEFLTNNGYKQLKDLKDGDEIFGL